MQVEHYFNRQAGVFTFLFEKDNDAIEHVTVESEDTADDLHAMIDAILGGGYEKYAQFMTALDTSRTEAILVMTVYDSEDNRKDFTAHFEGTNINYVDDAKKFLEELIDYSE